MRRVLVVNSGSSSLKYQLIEADTEQVIARGVIERIGECRQSRGSSEGASGLPPADARHTRSPEAPSEDEHLALNRSELPSEDRHHHVQDFSAAFQLMLEQLEAQGVDLAEPLAAIGHRVVHGGDRFDGPTLITPEVVDAIEELSTLAPLHNPPSLAGIAAAGETFPGVPQVAVFDTAFHQTLAPAAYRFAIDLALAERHGVRR